MTLEAAISHVSSYIESAPTVERNKTNIQSKRTSSLMVFEPWFQLAPHLQFVKLQFGYASQ